MAEQNMQDDGDELGTSVEVFVYDLSMGMAAMLAHQFIGRHLDGIWHTAVVAYGREYFFGPMGIQSIRPGSTELQEPLKIEKIGQTYLPYSVFWEYINGLGSTKFAPQTYNLINHNCNTFSDEVSNFLVGTGIPKYILDLPEELLSTPVGQALYPLIEKLSNGNGAATAGFTVGQRFVEARSIRREDSPEFASLNTEIEQARLQSIALEEKRNVINEKLAKKERKQKKKKDKKHKRDKDKSSSSSSSLHSAANTMSNMAEIPSTNGGDAPPPLVDSDMVDGAASAELGAVGSTEMLPSERILQMEEEEKREIEELKQKRDPPIVFRDTPDVGSELEKLRQLLSSDSDLQSIDELKQYLLENEGSWALGDNFLGFVGRVFHDKGIESPARVSLLNVLCAAALKDDVILLLHQDRKEHTVMNYAYDIDRHPLEEQLPLAQLMANLFENLSSSEWLMYISEWQYQSQNISNIRVTTKVAVHSLLSDSLDLQMRGTAIVHNLACKEVFDDVAVELTMALLQYFNGSPEEEQLYACMKSLSRFTQISGQEVPQLIQMIGPEPAKFRGCSQRIDELIDQINHKLTI